MHARNNPRPIPIDLTSQGGGERAGAILRLLQLPIRTTAQGTAALCSMSENSSSVFTLILELKTVLRAVAVVFIFILLFLSGREYLRFGILTVFLIDKLLTAHRCFTTQNSEVGRVPAFSSFKCLLSPHFDDDSRGGPEVSTWVYRLSKLTPIDFAPKYGLSLPLNLYNKFRTTD
ncbi:hypothetical protein GALMADRAFT_213469 [Galerina marginata CBS 339.88]|uniref:Uncharacterized protein n=1 Tax=Galerina marginata (strain CBS 339.88) TaxID=685588 RepID=A0A067SPQ3_GALM3|nr:hypothetical protein GALMADRAFT_213469 [Galerina marginata CBS 339.88]